MKKTILFLLFAVVLAGTSFALDVGKEYFVRSALHAVRGDEIYWVNYNDTAKTILIPAGSKVKITKIDGHMINFEFNGKKFNFAFTERGNTGTEDIFGKFFTTKDVNAEVNGYPEGVRSKIKRGIAEKGMTKEQVLFAVGAPAIIDGSQKTFNVTLKEILESDSWVYYYNRFNKWQIDFSNGRVSEIKN